MFKNFFLIVLAISGLCSYSSDVKNEMFSSYRFPNKFTEALYKLDNDHILNTDRPGYLRYTDSEPKELDPDKVKIKNFVDEIRPYLVNLFNPKFAASYRVPYFQLAKLEVTSKLIIDYLEEELKKDLNLVSEDAKKLFSSEVIPSVRKFIDESKKIVESQKTEAKNIKDELNDCIDYQKDDLREKLSNFFGSIELGVLLDLKNQTKQESREVVNLYRKALDKIEKYINGRESKTYLSYLMYPNPFLPADLQMKTFELYKKRLFQKLEDDIQGWPYKSFEELDLDNSTPKGPEVVNLFDKSSIWEIYSRVFPQIAAIKGEDEYRYYVDDSVRTAFVELINDFKSKKVVNKLNFKDPLYKLYKNVMDRFSKYPIIGYIISFLIRFLRLPPFSVFVSVAF